MTTNLANVWASSFASRLTQLKGQEWKFKARYLTLEIKNWILHGMVSELREIASMQILASPSTIMSEKCTAWASWRAHKIAAAYAEQGSIETILLVQNWMIEPEEFLATTMTAPKTLKDASTLSFTQLGGGAFQKELVWTTSLLSFSNTRKCSRILTSSFFTSTSQLTLTLLCTTWFLKFQIHSRVRAIWIEDCVFRALASINPLQIVQKVSTVLSINKTRTNTPHKTKP